MAIQARRQGGARGVHAPPPPPRSQKGPPDGIVKDLKCYKNNVVMVELTISMHFQQFEDLKFLIFFPGSMPLDPPKSQSEWPTVPNKAGMPDFT